MDDCLTRAKKISITTLEAENRSLRADVLTTTATLHRYMEDEMGVKLLHNAIRGQVISMCVCTLHYRLRHDIHWCRHPISLIVLVLVFWVSYYI